MRIEGVDIKAVFGGVPANAVDNLACLTELVGAEKAASIVKATGFETRRVAPEDTDVFDLALPAAKRALEGTDPSRIAGVIAVSFSNRDRFPALSARLQHALGLSAGTVAYDISMACSGWIYGLFAAAQLVKATGKKVLLADGDVQSAWTDSSDPNTLAVMGDGASATLLAPGEGVWDFAFYTDRDTDTIRTELDELLARIRERIAPLGLVMDEVILRSRLFRYAATDKGHPEIARLQKHIREVAKKEPSVCGMCLSDLNIFINNLNGNAVSCGVCLGFADEGGAHQPNVRVSCAELVDLTKTISSFIWEWDNV